MAADSPQKLKEVFMVTKDEFGSLIAEYEGFRDTIFDEIAKLREEIENIKEDIKDIKNTIDSDRNSARPQQRSL